MENVGQIMKMGPKLSINDGKLGTLYREGTVNYSVLGTLYFVWELYAAVSMHTQQLPTPSPELEFLKLE